MESEAWASAAAVAAISFACAIYYTSKAWFEHRERMAMIEHGIDPNRDDEKERIK